MLDEPATFWLIGPVGAHVEEPESQEKADIAMHIAPTGQQPPVGQKFFDIYITQRAETETERVKRSLPEQEQADVEQKSHVMPSFCWS